MKKDFLSMSDVNKQEILDILKLAEKIKKSPKDYQDALRSKTLVMFFEKPSTRTRLSFEIAMTQLGGHAIFFSKDSHFLATGEDIFDTSRVISRYADFLMARVNSHETLKKFSDYCDIPVINGLSDLEHPCQALADLYTIKQKKKNFKGLKIVFLGDGTNNTFHSLILACEKFGMDIVVSCHPNYKPKIKANYKIVENPKEAVSGADILYVDTFVSMGLEDEKERRLKDLQRYQLNPKLVELAKEDAIILHPMPMHRGLEITEDVIIDHKSIIFTQAENRLYVQKAILYTLRQATI